MSPRSRAMRRALLTVGLALALGYTWMYADITVPNERSRVYLTVALVDCGTLDIDCAVERFGPVNDWARHDGHYYTDKAPGSSLLAAIPYGLARLFSDPGDWTIAGLINLQRRLLMIPLALLGALLLWRALAHLGVTERTRDVAVAVWLLGSTAMHYASAFYGHQIVSVALLGAACWGLLAPWRGDRRWLEPRVVLAGAACGVAGLVEYQALPLALILALAITHRAWRGGRPTLVAGLALGALPFALAFVAYHAAAFDGPLDLSYNHLVSEAIQANHTRGVGGVGLPRLEAIHGVLLSLHRGLFATAPVFLLTPVGLWLLWRADQRRLAVTIGAVVAVGSLIAMGADVWYAGWSFGPRLLVPVLGLAVVAVAVVLDRLPRLEADESWLVGLAWGAVATGFIVHQLVNGVFPELPEDSLNPLVDIIAPMLARDQLSPNALTALFDARGAWTLAPVLALTLALLVWSARALHGRGRGARAWAMWALGALVVPGLLAATTAATPPTWSDAQRASWHQVVDHWDRVERDR